MRHYNLFIVISVISVFCAVADAMLQMHPVHKEGTILLAFAVYGVFGAMASGIFGMVQQHNYNESINKTLREGRKGRNVEKG